MRVTNRSLQFTLAALAVTALVSSVDAQVLPRNKNRAANQGANPPPRVEQRVEPSAPIRVDAQPPARTGVTVEQSQPLQTQQSQSRTGTQSETNISTSVNSRSDMNILRSTQIVGTTVSLQGNQQLGRIADVVFTDNGCISYVVVDMNGRLAPIPWRVGTYNYQNRVFVLNNIDRTRIERIPTFTNYQQFADQAFVSQVDSYFGVQSRGVEGRSDSVLRSTDTQHNTSINTQGTNRTDANRTDVNRTDANRSGTNRTDANRTDANRPDNNRDNNNAAPNQGSGRDSQPQPQRGANPSSDQKANSDLKGDVNVQPQSSSSANEGKSDSGKSPSADNRDAGAIPPAPDSSSDSKADDQQPSSDSKP